MVTISPFRHELEKLFHEKSRDKGIDIAINEWGYVLKEVRDLVHLHYSTVNRIAKKMHYAKTSPYPRRQENNS